MLKTALGRFVPTNILRRRKQGFVVPLVHWFRGALREPVHEALCGPVLRGSGLFDMTTIESLLDQHQSGARDYSPVLWSLLMFEGFLRQVHAGSAAHETERGPVLGVDA